MARGPNGAPCLSWQFYRNLPADFRVPWSRLNKDPGASRAPPLGPRSSSVRRGEDSRLGTPAGLETEKARVLCACGVWGGAPTPAFVSRQKDSESERTLGGRRRGDAERARDWMAPTHPAFCRLTLPPSERAITWQGALRAQSGSRARAGGPTWLVALQECYGFHIERMGPAHGPVNIKRGA